MSRDDLEGSLPCFSKATLPERRSDVAFREVLLVAGHFVVLVIVPAAIAVAIVRRSRLLVSHRAVYGWGFLVAGIILVWRAIPSGEQLQINLCVGAMLFCAAVYCEGMWTKRSRETQLRTPTQERQPPATPLFSVVESLADPPDPSPPSFLGAEDPDDDEPPTAA